MDGPLAIGTQQAGGVARSLSVLGREAATPHAAAHQAMVWGRRPEAAVRAWVSRELGWWLGHGR